MDTETNVESKQKSSEDDDVKEMVDDIVIPAFHKVPEPRKKTSSKKTVIFHDKPGTALTKQKEIDSHNFP